MCMGCWNEYGSPRIDNANVREAAVAIKEVYEHNGVGGNLHIVVDDFNIEDGSLEFCRECIKENPHESSREQLEAESRCLDILERITVDERASALALHDGFWKPEAS